MLEQIHLSVFTENTSLSIYSYGSSRVLDDANNALNEALNISHVNNVLFVKWFNIKYAFETQICYLLLRFIYSALYV